MMKKNSVLIELTPLLDVILIMLFFILVQSEGRMGTFYDEVREAFEAEVATIEAELDAFKAEHADEMEHLRRVGESYDALRLGLEEDTGIILINIVTPDRDDLDTRWILIESDSQSTRIDLSWSIPAREAAAVELNTALAGKIQNAGNTVMLIVFRYDSSLMFHGDRRMVDNAIHIQRQFNQLVVTELDIRV